MKAAGHIDAGGGRGANRTDQVIADWNETQPASPGSPSLAIAAMRNVSHIDMFEDWEHDRVKSQSCACVIQHEPRTSPKASWQ